MLNTPIYINQLHYSLTSGKTIFSNLTLSFPWKRTGLLGRNGIGKSTLLKLIVNELHLQQGSIQRDCQMAYVAQHSMLSQDTTIAKVLGYEEKIFALRRIQQGSIDEIDFTILNEDWDVEDRLQKQLRLFALDTLPSSRRVSELSGGEFTRLLLTKAFTSGANFLILDEPTNHLDQTARCQLYAAIQEWQGGLIIVSHDRTLLNLMDEIVELTSLGATCYGGNYDLYFQQKEIERNAKEQQLQDAQKFLKKTQQSIQASHEKHEQKQSYGRELRKSGSIDKLAANAKQGKSERSQNRLLIKEERMTKQAESELKSAKEKIEITDEIHVNLEKTHVPEGKVLLDIEDLTFSYSNNARAIIKEFNFIMRGPERIALIGDNGSGKTTLVKLILTELSPDSGKIYCGTDRVKYLDQTASLLCARESVLKNFMRMNPDASENQAYRCLAQFLFKNVAVEKLVSTLSGGERLRALLACVLMASDPPQLLILDEPTNHLDLASVVSIESVLKNYWGGLVVVSHDGVFLKNIGVGRVIDMGGVGGR